MFGTLDSFRDFNPAIISEKREPCCGLCCAVVVASRRGFGLSLSVLSGLGVSGISGSDSDSWGYFRNSGVVLNIFNCGRIAGSSLSVVHSSLVRSISENLTSV